MTTDPTLFPLSEKAPRKLRPTAARIMAYKKANGILTHRTEYPLEVPWLAVKVPPKRLDDGGPIEGMDVGDMVASFGRLLDEGGWTGTGRGELAAIRDLCMNRKIPCPL
jgi:hypothetical protein